MYFEFMKGQEARLLKVLQTPKVTENSELSYFRVY